MTVVALVAVTAACGGNATTADDPVAVAKAFLSAVQRADCAAAWSHFSRGTQENITAEVHWQKRHRQYAAEPIPEPMERYCQGSYGTFEGDARLVTADGERASVSALFSEGTHLALIPFLSTPYREWRDVLQLVREEGRWKVERPRARIGREGWSTEFVGEVDVSRPEHGGNPHRTWVEAEAVLRAPRARIEALLMDPLAWPRFVPHVKDVVPVSGPDADGGWIWELHLEGGGTTAQTLVHVRPYGRLRQETLPWTKVQWTTSGYRESRDGPGTPPLFTGSYELREHFDGVHVTYGIVIQPDEWPAALADQLVASPAVASALANLDKAAAAP